MSKSKEDKEEETNGAIGTFYFDYTYMTDCCKWIKRDDYDEAVKVYKTISRPILVELDGWTEALFAHRVDNKGVAGGWPVKRRLEDMKEVGYSGSTIITRCDQ